MKKIFIILMILAVGTLPLNVKADSDKITVYMFKGETCVHCEQALDYISEHLDEIPDNVEIITYEITEDNDNAELMDATADYIGVDKTQNFGTPFFVIGSNYEKGYTPGTWEELFAYASDYEENGDYEDIVKKVIEEEELDVKSEPLENVISIPNNTVTIIVYCVFGAIVLGFIALMVFGRK